MFPLLTRLCSLGAQNILELTAFCHLTAWEERFREVRVVAERHSMHQQPEPCHSLGRSVSVLSSVVPKELLLMDLAVCYTSSMPTETGRGVCWCRIVSCCFLTLGPSSAVLECPHVTQSQQLHILRGAWFGSGHFPVLSPHSKVG